MTRTKSDALVFCGATGDLAKKQIFPALQSMIAHGRLDVPVIGVAKAGWTLEQLRERARQSCAEHGGVDERAFARLMQLLDYVDGDYRDPGTFGAVREKLGDAQAPTHYLAIPPTLFAVVTEQLHASGCSRGARVVVEKPFGRDLASAKQLNATLHKTFAEDDIYRIDHFLGKEAVQNIVVFRFANRVFEPVWSAEHIACVQITMAESFGVAGRGPLYDELGAIRDVVQNHLLQVLALLTMEPPDGSDHARIRDRVAAVLRRVRPLEPGSVVRGQFAGYHQVPGVKPDSNIETYAAMRIEIDTPRWKGVPIFIRAGKALPRTATEVVIDFAASPVTDYAPGANNRLRLRLTPELIIALKAEIKRPGEAMTAEPIELCFAHHAQKGEMTAYERLLGDAMNGDPTLFARQDAVEASWAIVDPVLDDRTPVEVYAPGTWGPASAKALPAGVGGWRDPDGAAQPEQIPHLEPHAA